jgi:hypothetical protein
MRILIVLPRQERATGNEVTAARHHAGAGIRGLVGTFCARLDLRLRNLRHPLAALDCRVTRSLPGTPHTAQQLAGATGHAIDCARSVHTAVNLRTRTSRGGSARSRHALLSRHVAVDASAHTGIQTHASIGRAASGLHGGIGAQTQANTDPRTSDQCRPARHRGTGHAAIKPQAGGVH